MSHVRSNFDTFFTKEIRDFTEIELDNMDRTQFDALPLSDQISIYNNHRDAYDRLTGRATEDTTAHTEDSRTDAQRFADSFEARIDAIITRAFRNESQ